MMQDESLENLYCALLFLLTRIGSARRGPIQWNWTGPQAIPRSLFEHELAGHDTRVAGEGAEEGVIAAWCQIAW